MRGVFEKLRRALSVLALLGNAFSMPAAGPPAFVVHGPTVIAFFPRVTQKQVDSDPELSEALGDFQYYATEAAEQLRKAGITFRQVFAPSLRVRLGTGVITFRPGKAQSG